MKNAKNKKRRKKKILLENTTTSYPLFLSLQKNRKTSTSPDLISGGRWCPSQRLFFLSFRTGNSEPDLAPGGNSWVRKYVSRARNRRDRYKNQLQELAQRSCFNLPSYTCIRRSYQNLTARSSKNW